LLPGSLPLALRYLPGFCLSWTMNDKPPGPLAFALLVVFFSAAAYLGAVFLLSC